MYSKHLKYSIDNVFIILIYLMISLNSVSGIMYLQVSPFEYWEIIIVYTRLIIIALDLTFILIYYLRGVTSTHKLNLCVYLYIAYSFAVSVMFFCPNIIHLVINAFTWPLTFVVFYLYSEKRELPLSFQRVLIITSLLICLFLVRTIQTSDSEETNVGTVYYGITCLPIILAICNTKTKLFFSVAVTIGFVLAFVCHILQTRQIEKKKMRIFGLILLACIAVSTFVYYINNSNNAIIDRFKNITSDQGSGRVVIWNQIMEAFNSSPIINKIFGHGYHAVSFEVMPIGQNIYAHNGFIEALYDFGIVGFVWMVLIMESILYAVVRMIKEKDLFAPASLMAITIVIVFSCVSYFFDESGTIMHFICFWGIVQGRRSNKTLFHYPGVLKADYETVPMIIENEI